MLLCFTLPQNIAVLLYKSASRHNYPRPFSAYFMERTHTRGIFDIFKMAEGCNPSIVHLRGYPLTQVKPVAHTPKNRSDFLKRAQESRGLYRTFPEKIGGLKIC